MGAGKGSANATPTRTMATIAGSRTVCTDVRPETPRDALALLGRIGGLSLTVAPATRPTSLGEAHRYAPSGSRFSRVNCFHHNFSHCGTTTELSKQTALVDVFDLGG